MVRNSWTRAALMAAMLMGTGFTASADAWQAPQGAKPAPVARAPLNLNVATAAELQTLPGIGPALAARILEYRQKNGGFKKVEELMNVQGIGEQSFLKLKALLVVAPVKTAEQ